MAKYMKVGLLSLAVIVGLITVYVSKNSMGNDNITFRFVSNQIESGTPIHGFKPGKSWIDFLELLSIDPMNIEKTPHGYSLSPQLEISLNNHGYIIAGKSTFENELVTVSFIFYQEKLIGVDYIFELKDKDEKEQLNTYRQLVASMIAIFGASTHHENSSNSLLFSESSSWNKESAIDNIITTLIFYINVDSVTGNYNVKLSIRSALN